MRRLLMTYLRYMRRGPELYVSDRFLAARLDRAAMKRTLLTLLALLCVVVLIFMLHELVAPLLVFVVPILVVPAFAYAASPLGYAIDNRALYIERKALRTIRIPLGQITAIRYVPRASLQGAIRIYGTGGLFGWAGRYRIPTLGTANMHATNLDQLIVVQRRYRKPVIISPAEPEKFLSGLRRQYTTIQA